MSEGRLYKHFLEQLAELRRLLDQPEEADTHRASAILRQLLIDSGGLINQVNSEIRYQLKFSVWRPIDRGASSGVLMDVRFDERIPRLDEEGEDILRLKLGQYLRHHVLTGMDTKYCVEDVIRLVANTYGGVHFAADGHNDNPSAKKLGEYDKGTMRGDDSYGGDYSFARNLVVTIGRTTLVACEPLENVIRARSW